MQDEPVPGALVVWTGSQPCARAFPIGAAGLVLGRDMLGGTDDDRISKQHLRLTRVGEPTALEDLGSRNGTYVAGHAMTEPRTVAAYTVLRVGRTVAVLLPDLRPFDGAAPASVHGAVIGGASRAAWRELAAAARDGAHVVVLGEPGSGRGALARAYAAERGRPAAAFGESAPAPEIETLVAEEPGPHGAAALLELVAARPALRVVCTARAGDPPPARGWPEGARSVVLPPLRDRPDELALHVRDAVRLVEPALACHATLIEACLLRPNHLGELTAVLAGPAHGAVARGKTTMHADDLAFGAPAAWVIFPARRS